MPDNLVSVIPGFLHTNNTHNRWIYSPDTTYRFFNDFLLQNQLLIISNVLIRATSALIVIRTFGFYPMWRFFYDFSQNTSGIFLFFFNNFCIDELSWNSMWYKNYLALISGNSLSIVAYAFN